MKPSNPVAPATAATTDERSPSKPSKATGSGDAKREGPARLPDQLDRTGRWNESSAHPGYQQHDQGGYRGGYDEAKFEKTERENFSPADGDRPSGPGQPAPAKTPLHKDDRFQGTGPNASDSGGNKNK
jgi:hypothetical protein